MRLQQEEFNLTKNTSLVGYGREKMENSKLKTLNVRWK